MSNVGSLMQFLCNKSICRRIVKKKLWVADLDWTDSIFTVIALCGRPYIILLNVFCFALRWRGARLHTDEYKTYPCLMCTGLSRSFLNNT